MRLDMKLDWQKAKIRRAFETAKRMLALKEFTSEKIAAISGLSLDEVKNAAGVDGQKKVK